MMLHRTAICLTTLLAGSLAARTVAAQTKVHIVDINKQSVPISLNPAPKRADRNHYKRAREFVRLGSRAIFQGFSGRTGREIFAATATGTSVDLLLDIEPGPRSSSPTEFVQAGTKMLQDLNLGRGSSRPGSLSAVGARHMWFQARGLNSTSRQGYELWKLDTATGVAKLQADIAPGMSNGNPVGFSRRGQTPFGVMQGKVWFSAWTSASGVELMFTEGGATAQGQGQSCQSSVLTSTDPVLGRTASITGKTRSGFLGNVLLLGTASPVPIRMTSACMLYLAPFAPMLTIQVSTGNTYGLQVKIPATPSFSGMQLLLQCIHLGAAFPSTSGFSNAVEWTLGQ